MVWSILLIVVGGVLLLGAIGLFREKSTTDNGKKKFENLKAGTASLLFGIVLIIVGIAIWPTSNKIVTAPQKEQKVQQTTTQSDKSVANGKDKKIATSNTPQVQSGQTQDNTKPLYKEQLTGMLSWSNQKYQEICSRFEGLQPNSYMYADPGWSEFARDNQALITQKEQSFPQTSTPAANGEEVQWLIQADVQGAMEQVWQTLTSMNEYLGASGNYSDITNDEKIYQQFYTKAQKELATGLIQDIGN